MAMPGPSTSPGVHRDQRRLQLDMTGYSCRNVFVLVGLLFKVGAVPFHAWTPDVCGAPTPSQASWPACTKLAAFGAILRLVVGIRANRDGTGARRGDGDRRLMVVGSILSVTQTDMKRLLAFTRSRTPIHPHRCSGIRQAGVSGVMFYALSWPGDDRRVRHRRAHPLRVTEAGHLTQKSSGPGSADPTRRRRCVFALLLLTFAGIPLTSGFTAKFAAFAHRPSPPEARGAHSRRHRCPCSVILTSSISASSSSCISTTTAVTSMADTIDPRRRSLRPPSSRRSDSASGRDRCSTSPHQAASSSADPHAEPRLTVLPGISDASGPASTRACWCDRALLEQQVDRDPPSPKPAPTCGRA